MKINSVTIEDKGTNTFLIYIEQFPGICAQADTVDEASVKVKKYFDAFIERMKDREVNNRIVSMD